MYAHRNNTGHPYWKFFVDSYTKRKQLVMFSKTYIPECIICKRSLRRLPCVTDQNFFTLELEKRQDCCQIETYLMKLAGNCTRQVPLFFYDGVYIGGYLKIISLELEGGLESYIENLLLPNVTKECPHPVCANIIRDPATMSVKFDTKFGERESRKRTQDSMNFSMVDHMRITGSRARGIDFYSSQYKKEIPASPTPVTLLHGDPKAVIGTIGSLEQTQEEVRRHRRPTCHIKVGSFGTGSEKSPVTLDSIQEETHVPSANEDESTVKTLEGSGLPKEILEHNQFVVNEDGRETYVRMRHGKLVNKSSMYEDVWSDMKRKKHKDNVRSGRR